MPIECRSLPDRISFFSKLPCQELWADCVPIPYPDRNQNFKIYVVILSQIVLILKKKIAKNRPDMEVWTIFSGKSWGGQVKSGQISGAAVRTKGAFSGSGLPYYYPGPVDKSRHTHSGTIWVFRWWPIKLRAGEEILTLRRICRLGAIVWG